MAKRRWAIAIAAILGLVAAGWSLRTAPANAVKTEAAGKPAPRRPYVAAAGRVEPAGEEIKLGSSLDGRLAEVLADEGDEVRQGQVLARIENAEYQARLQSAEALVREREAILERLRNGARPEEKREAEARLQEADAQLQLASVQRDRRRALWEAAVGARSDYDAAIRDVDAARSAVAALRERMAVVNSQTRPEEIRSAEASLAHAIAAAAEAAAMLSKTLIHSPITGRVLRRHKKSGEVVVAMSDPTVFTLGDTRRLHVRVDVDETDVGAVFAGQEAIVKAEAFQGREFRGKVVRVGQALGRKNVVTERPSEPADRRIMETLIALDPGQTLPVGLRVDAYLSLRE